MEHVACANLQSSFNLVPRYPFTHFFVANQMNIQHKVCLSCHHTSRTRKTGHPRESNKMKDKEVVSVTRSCASTKAQSRNAL